MRNLNIFAANLKHFCTILFIVLLFLQTFARLWSFVAFKINQKQIALTLCVQRNMANNACQGNCFFMQQLKKIEQEKQVPLPKAPLVEKGEVPFFLPPVSVICSPLFKKVITRYRLPVNNGQLPDNYSNCIYQPPEPLV